MCTNAQGDGLRVDYWILMGMVKEREVEPLVPVTTTEDGPAGTGVKNFTRLPPHPLLVISRPKATRVSTICDSLRRRLYVGISVSRPTGSRANAMSRTGFAMLSVELVASVAGVETETVLVWMVVPAMVSDVGDKVQVI